MAHEAFLGKEIWKLQSLLLGVTVLSSHEQKAELGICRQNDDTHSSLRKWVEAWL